MKRKYLIDFDNTIFDIYTGFIEAWNKDNFSRRISLDNLQEHYYLERNFENVSRNEGLSILSKRGFFENLSPIAGSIEAVNKIEEKYGEVFFVTTPYLFGLTEMNYPYSPSEKYELIRKNFGAKWLNKIILVNDKSLVKGDFLIDDSPNLKYSETPTWQRIIYTQNYNKDIFGLRLDWKNWEKVICSL